jgi:hypothetical protein
MNFTLKSVAIAALGTWLGVTTIAPANAVPRGELSVQAPSNIENVRYKKLRHGHGRHGHWNGHRGYRHYRPGYRRYNDGFWYPLAAFSTGIIIGNMIGNQPRGIHSHVQWCRAHYRSYRTSDNTYQPYHGPRRACRSPYR